jgi:antitoxin (DNA-binding transcriptional repressor) of toxin-antitoxin stability system
VKVKIGELKARLSHYLRLVKESGDAIEVCAREETVAYLVPVNQRAPNPAELREMERLQRRFSNCGLRLAAGAPGQTALPEPEPSVAGDKRTDIASVEGLRDGKGW